MAGLHDKEQSRWCSSRTFSTALALDVDAAETGLTRVYLVKRVLQDALISTQQGNRTVSRDLQYRHVAYKLVCWFFSPFLAL